jgi:mannose-1-phosphate guanylyltransferase
MPELADGLDAIAPHVGKPTFDRALARTFPKLPSTSIDYGIMEKARNIVVVPAEFGWSDVGSFAALPEVRPADGQGNVVSGLALPVGSRGCVILADPKRPLAVVGMDDIIAVDAGDAILVCPKSRAQEVRKAVEELEKRKLGKFV